MDFEIFFKQHQKMIYRMICRYVRKSDVAEELVLDSFMKVYERWDRVSMFENPVGYLVRVSINRAKKEVLKRKVIEFFPFEEELVSRRDHPEDRVLVKEENEQMQLLLDKLKSVEKEIISLKDLDGLKFGDIVSALQMKLPTVKSHYRRGKEKLLKMLEESNEV